MFVFRVVLLASLFAMSTSVRADNVNFSIGFVATDLNRVNLVGGKIDRIRPGWFVELSDTAGAECGADISYIQLPWKRILQRVEKGKLSAALNSSFKRERTAFGAYPMADGKPDISRAHSHYAYYFYALGADNLERLTQAEGLRGAKVAAEPESVVLPILEKEGAEILSVTNYTDALDMLASSRADGLAGIDSVFDDMIAENPGSFSKVVKSEKPILERAGYLMFAKATYEAIPDIVECFWTESARLRASDWFRRMRASYN